MSTTNGKFTAAELVPGQFYWVTKAFADYDGIIHPVGEYWRFTKDSFLPYEDGLSLFIEKSGKESYIRLQWRDETQGQIIDNFSDYVTKV